jgi:hypothetical protein
VIQEFVTPPGQMKAQLILKYDKVIKVGQADATIHGIADLLQYLTPEKICS